MDAIGLRMLRWGLCSSQELWGDIRGATAVELALVFPAFITCIVGGFYVCLGVFNATSLQYAVEQGARCAAVNSVTCPDSASTISYAKNHYLGLASAVPTFTYASASCGYSLTGSVDYVFNFGMSTVTVPISATACFP